MAILFTVSALIPFYLMGAFPTGYLIARRYGIEITKTGSGNVGAANVARSVGLKAGLFTLLGDVAKGFLAVLLAAVLSNQIYFQVLAGLSAIAGHCFSIPGRLAGGKGVATALGAFLYLTPYCALAALLVFAVMLWAGRMTSLASITAALTAPIFALLTNTDDYHALGMMAAAALLLVRHKDNIVRITQGKEPRFSWKK